MYKLICADMDGTVLDDKKYISERTIKDIYEAGKMGVKFVVATGRLVQSACYFGDLIGVTTPIIASNGAVIMYKDGGKTIFKSSLSCDDCRLIYKLFLKYGINPHFYGTDTIYSGKLEFLSLNYKKFNERLPDKRKVKIVIVDDWNKFFKVSPEIIKAVAIGADGEKIKRAREEFEAVTDFQIVHSMKDSFEIMKKGTSKGLAVKRVAEYYGIKRDEIIALGDSENDLSMIEYAGLGVAMGNAEELLKKRADYITGANNDDGVAEVIEKFILNNVKAEMHP